MKTAKRAEQEEKRRKNKERGEESIHVTAAR
jgi:hypothetical protein